MDSIVVGANGQDGRILCEWLVQNGKSVFQILNGSVSVNGINQRQNTSSQEFICDVVSNLQPSRIYYLAAYHSSSTEEVKPKDIELSYYTNTILPSLYLEAISKCSPKSRFFFASSSLAGVGGKFDVPSTVYGLSKRAGAEVCKYYRSRKGLYAAVGTLFNHESEYRSNKFLSTKIIENLIQIKRGNIDSLVVGNLTGAADWGYARDYMKAAVGILDCNEPDDYEIGTGQLHQVSDWIKVASNVLGIDCSSIKIHENKDIIKREPNIIVANIQKIRQKTGWVPETSFEQMVKIMVDSLERELI